MMGDAARGSEDGEGEGGMRLTVDGWTMVTLCGCCEMLYAAPRWKVELSMLAPLSSLSDPSSTPPPPLPPLPRAGDACGGGCAAKVGERCGSVLLAMRMEDGMGDGFLEGGPWEEEVEGAGEGLLRSEGAVGWEGVQPMLLG